MPARRPGPDTAQPRLRLRLPPLLPLLILVATALASAAAAASSAPLDSHHYMLPRTAAAAFAAAPRRSFLRVWTARRRLATTMAASAGKGAFPYRLYDSHLHVWTDGQPPFPYAEGQGAPPGLQQSGTAEQYLELMADAGVQKSCIVQPILFLYDHSYVKAVMEKHPGKFKGMLNANPTLAPEAAAAEVRRLHAQGFGSVRFNPYIWPAGRKMDDATGRAMYKTAGALGMPVGFMLFKGLHLHLPEVTALLEAHPETPAIIDHWGFFHQDGRDVEEAWAQLLALAKYPQLSIKVSAFFRVSSAQWPFANLAPRLEALNRAYGSHRLMWGSDFPYVTTLGGGYVEAPRAVLAWKEQGLLPSFTEEDFANLFSGTFERVLGK